MQRRAFTLIELLVVIATIGLLVALLLPAVQSAREASRRIQCNSNLKQLGLAIANYESLYAVLPWGISHKYQILPFIEQTSVYQQRNNSGTTEDEIWGPISGVTLPLFFCPTDPAPEAIGSPSTGGTNYLACAGSGVQKYGVNGMFGFGTPDMVLQYGDLSIVKLADVTNGLSNTAALSECLRSDGTANRLRMAWNTPVSMPLPNELDAFADYCAAIPSNPLALGWVGAAGLGIPWYGGGFGAGLYNHVLTPNYPSCMNENSLTLGGFTATSLHHGGVNVLYGDGHVSFVSESIDRHEWRKMGARSDSVSGF